MKQWLFRIACFFLNMIIISNLVLVIIFLGSSNVEAKSKSSQSGSIFLSGFRSNLWQEPTNHARYRNNWRRWSPHPIPRSKGQRKVVAIFASYGMPKGRINFGPQHDFGIPGYQRRAHRVSNRRKMWLPPLMPMVSFPLKGFRGKSMGNHQGFVTTNYDELNNHNPTKPHNGLAVKSEFENDQRLLLRKIGFQTFGNVLEAGSRPENFDKTINKNKWVEPDNKPHAFHPQQHLKDHGEKTKPPIMVDINPLRTNVKAGESLAEPDSDRSHENHLPRHKEGRGEKPKPAIMVNTDLLRANEKVKKTPSQSITKQNKEVENDEMRTGWNRQKNDFEFYPQRNPQDDINGKDTKETAPLRKHSDERTDFSPDDSNVGIGTIPNAIGHVEISSNDNQNNDFPITKMVVEDIRKAHREQMSTLNNESEDVKAVEAEGAVETKSKKERHGNSKMVASAYALYGDGKANKSGMTEDDKPLHSKTDGKERVISETYGRGNVPQEVRNYEPETRISSGMSGIDGLGHHLGHKVPSDDEIGRSHRSSDDPPLNLNHARRRPRINSDNPARKGRRYRREVGGLTHEGIVIKNHHGSEKKEVAKETGEKTEEAVEAVEEAAETEWKKEHRGKDKDEKVAGVFVLFEDGKVKKSGKTKPKVVKDEMFLDDRKYFDNENESPKHGHPAIDEEEAEAKAGKPAVVIHHKKAKAKVLRPPTGADRHHTNNVVGGVIALCVFASFAVVMALTIAHASRTDGTTPRRINSRTAFYENHPRY